MNESLQSVLTALGNAVINSIWQTGLVWLLVLIYTRFSKRLSAVQLSNISFAALLTGFSSFIATFFLSFAYPGSGLGMVTWLSHIPALESLMVYAAITYILLLTIPLIRLAMGTKSIYTLRRKGLGKVPGSLKIFTLDASQYLNIKRKVGIFTSTLISSPLTVGFIKPVILLPVAMINQLSMEQAQAVILHELAHIRRNDYLQNLITQIILTILYFNPFIRLLARMQNLEREKSADNWVMQFEYDNCMYAKTLLLLARQNKEVFSTLAIPISGKRSPLLERVEFILGAGKRRYPSPKTTSLWCSLIMGMLVTSMVSKPHSGNITDGALAATISWATEPATGLQFASNTATSLTLRTSDTKAAPAVFFEEKPAANLSGGKQSASAEKTIGRKTDECTDNTDIVPAIFVSHAETAMPVLAAEEEKEIQNAVKATQKIVVEMSWNAIDHSLAETVTEQEKLALKDAYSRKIKTADWEKQANVLRLRYKDIDWEKATKKIALVIADIKVDSLYKEYKNTSLALYEYKKQLEQDTASTKKEIAVISDLINQYRNAIQKIDSVRSKKVIEL